ncbi:MAG: hypothetical protein HYV27_16290 [Candidatus Hydrogenedentes bacterium]|nr:hypothetical protein [Candidatus Hydrogenedentota bacterium]
MAVTPLPSSAAYTVLRFSMACPGCHRELHIPVQYEGRAGKCKHCGYRFQATPPGAKANEGDSKQDGYVPCPPEWYAEREAHFDYCRHNYVEAVSHHPGQKRNYQWEQLLDQAKQCDNPEMQKQFYWRAIDLGVHWPEAYERLARIYLREEDAETAYQICIRYFESDYWRRAPWYKNSKHFLRFMKKVDTKLHGRADLSSVSEI